MKHVGTITSISYKMAEFPALLFLSKSRKAAGLLNLWAVWKEVFKSKKINLD